MGRWKDQYGVKAAYKIESISMVVSMESLLVVQNAAYYFSTQCWITHARQGPSPLPLESDRALQKCSLKYSKESTVSSEWKSLELGQWRRCKAQRFVGMCVWNEKLCFCSLTNSSLLFWLPSTCLNTNITQATPFKSISYTKAIYSCIPYTALKSIWCSNNFDSGKLLVNFSNYYKYIELNMTFIR